MEPRVHPLIYLHFAMLHTSASVARAVGQAIKFSLDRLQDISYKTNYCLEEEPTSEIKGHMEIALTAIEFHINFIRYSMNPFTTIRSFTAETVKHAQTNSLQLQERLASVGPLSEENGARGRRIEECFGDVIFTLEKWEQQQRSGVKRRRQSAGAQENDTVEPMLRYEIFNSEEEQIFLLRLRNLHLRAASSSPTTTLHKLHLLCQDLRPDTIPLSEAMTDTALRSIILLLFKSKNQVYQGGEIYDHVPPNVFEYLQSCFLAMNQPAHLEWKVESSIEYRNYVNYRKYTIVNELATINELITIATPGELLPVAAPLPVLESAPGDPPSALWRKLQFVASVAALTEGADNKCAICLKEGFLQGNFAIQDNCIHKHCTSCITTWFQSKSTCPQCRATTFSWTTKEHFTSFRKLIETDEDIAQPAKRPRFG